MRCINILLLTVLLRVLVFAFILQTTVDGVSAQAVGDDEGQTIQLVVMIKSQLGLGAGILFGRKDDRIYIATSNHVVRRGTTEAQDIHVMLKGLPGQWLEASLSKHFDANPDVDLAVLSLEGLEQHGIKFCGLPLNRLGDTSTLKRGDAVYPVGYPNGAPWAFPIVPDRIAQIVGQQITFQSAFISNGHSGGGLLNEHEELIGMIRADQQPFGVAINIARIVASLRQWGYPVQLHTKAVVKGKTLLHLAVEQRNLDESRRLLQDCFDPNKPDDDGKTPLHAAAFHAGPEIVQLLLEAGAEVNITDRYGRTPLHAAVGSGNLDVVKQLLSWGAETDQTTLRHAFDHPVILEFLLTQRPRLDPGLLYWAVRKGRHEIVERLLAQGMDANGSENRGSPLHQAAERGDVETATILLAHGAAVNSRDRQTTPLHIAADEGSLKLVELLLANGAEIDADEGRGITPLWYALKFYGSPGQAHLAVVQTLLKAGAQFKAMAGREKRLLENLVEKRNLDLIRILLDYGLDPNDYDSGYNPLGSAIEIDQEDSAFEIARLLVSHGADVNAKYAKRGEEYGTPLLYAIYRGRIKIAQLLIEAGAELEVRNSYRSGKKPLHEAAYRGFLEVVRSLLAHGARINSRDQYERTPLYLAAESNQAEIVRILLAHGADPNPSGTNAYQPLEVVASEGYLQIAKMLIEAGANVQAGQGDYRFIPLHTAASKGHSELVQLLIEAGALVDLQDRDSRTALHKAVSEGRLAVVRTLVNAGADVNACDNNRTSPLSLVKGDDAAAIADLLIKAGAELEGRDRKSRAPLHHAVLSRELSLAVCLLKAGADVNARDENGDTPLHLAAQDEEGASVAQVLIDAGADLLAVNLAKETALMVAERNDSNAYEVLRANFIDK